MLIRNRKGIWTDKVERGMWLENRRTTIARKLVINYDWVMGEIGEIRLKNEAEALVEKHGMEKCGCHDGKNDKY